MSQWPDTGDYKKSKLIEVEKAKDLEDYFCIACRQPCGKEEALPSQEITSQDTKRLNFEV